MAEKAVKYLYLAGQRAVRLLANEEAIAHFNRALELLQTLAESTARDEQELALQLGLFAPLVATRGWTPPELGRACSRALELCRQLGESPQTFTALGFLRYYYITRGESRTSLELAKQVIDLAQRSQDPLQLLGAHHGMGLSLFHMGEFQQSRMHLEQVIASYDSAYQRDLTLVYGYDLGALTLSYQANNLWFLGYSDQALNRIQEAVALARELNHPFSLAFALLMICCVHRGRRDPPAVQSYAEEAMRLSMEGEFSLLQSWATFFLGWIGIQRGGVEAGIEQMLQGMTGWRSMGMGSAVPTFLAMTAEAYGKAGRVEEGLGLAQEALDLVEKSGERAWEAEAIWVRGDLLQLSGKLSEAEASFRQAIEVARRQEAKSWELRATLSLSRLLQKTGRSEEARQFLSEIYAWFTEGFGTPDLKEARALLEEFQKEGGKEGRGVLG